VDADRDEPEASLWQGDGPTRRHVDSISARCLGCGTIQAVPSENSSFRCRSGHPQTFLRCSGCRGAFQNWQIGDPCPWCLGTQLDGQVTAWEWAADQIRHAQRRSLLPSRERPTALAGPDEDSYRLSVDGVIVAAVGFPPLAPHVACRLDFYPDEIIVTRLRPVSNLDAAVAIPLGDVKLLRVDGPGATTSTSLRGSGVVGSTALVAAFSLPGAGLLYPAAHALRRKTTTTVETLVHLNAGARELLMATSQMTPQVLQVRLAPMFAQMDALQAAPASIPQANSSSLADEIRKLAALRDEGILSDGEFAAAKARLLGSA
jgi:hypothetical protein